MAALRRVRIRVVVLLAVLTCCCSRSQPAGKEQQSPIERQPEGQVDALARSLGGKNPKTSWAAFNKLKSLGKGALPRLVELAEGKDLRLRLGAVRGLAAIHPAPLGKKTVSLLGRLLEVEDAELRLALLNTIDTACATSGKTLFGPTQKMLGVSDKRVARLAVSVLIKFSPSKALDVFVKGLKAEQAVARTNAVEGLRQLGPKAASSAREQLLTAVGDSDSGVREAACLAVAAVAPKSRDVWATVGKAMLTDKTAFVRIAAASALKTCIRTAPQKVPAETIAALGKALEDFNHLVRGESLAALEAVGAQAAPLIKPLRRTLRNDGKRNNRSAAARILGNLPMPTADRAVADLVAAVTSDSRSSVRDSAALALKKLSEKSPRAASALRRANQQKR